MGRTRDVSKILTSNTSILSLASASTTYATKASSGLTLINTTSFSAVGFHFVNAFTSTYDDYLINIDIDNASTTANLVFRLSTASSVSITTGYYYLGSTSTNASLANFAGDNQQQWIIGETSATAPTNSIHTIQLSKPFIEKRTGITYRSHNYTGTANKSWQASGYHDQNTAYPQFALIASVGNITGKASVYGYNK
jgi:hypothetical protein